MTELDIQVLQIVGGFILIIFAALLITELIITLIECFQNKQVNRIRRDRGPL